MRFGGIEWTLPAEVSFEFAELAGQADIRGAMAAIIGDRVDEFFALKPSTDDMTAFVKTAMQIYGIDEGKAPASSDS